MEIRASAEGMILRGLAAPFWERAKVGHGYFEELVPGCFQRTLAERGHKIRLYSLHVTNPSSGQPIGKPKLLEERREGLWSEWHLADTQQARDAVALIRSGVADGLSIGFQELRSVPRRGSDGQTTQRRLEVALDHVALVASAAYPSARVSGVHHAT